MSPDRALEHWVEVVNYEATGEHVARWDNLLGKWCIGDSPWDTDVLRFLRPIQPTGSPCGCDIRTVWNTGRHDCEVFR